MKLKEQFEQATFQDFITHIPEDYRIAFSLLWNDYLNIESIVNITKEELDKIVSRYNETVQDQYLNEKIFFGVNENDENCLRSILIRTFFK